MSEEKKESVQEKSQTTAKPSVKWDDSKMQTTYANVVNVTSTREEVSVFFGTNQTWHIPEDKEFDVQLTDRIVLNPYAAKRLSILLSTVLKEYETRFGPLDIDLSNLKKQ
ncbi:MAG: DUF3467 domain-containing protein [Methylococcaceae bacterium]|nr:DUF3467 domain-containing protein [Methylococcaceae bacterium]